jgi:hypothetical protein
MPSPAIADDSRPTVIHRAVLALANQRRAGQDNRKHRDAADDTHHTGEPGGHHIGVESDPGR